jgi:hypothetical protein
VEGSPNDSVTPEEGEEDVDDKFVKRSKLHRSMDMEEERELFAALSLLSGMYVCMYVCAILDDTSAYARIG